MSQENGGREREGGKAAWTPSVQRTQPETRSSENQAVYSKPWEAPPHQEKMVVLCLTGQGRVLRIHEQSSVRPTSWSSVGQLLPFFPLLRIPQAVQPALGTSRTHIQRSGWTQHFS